MTKTVQLDYTQQALGELEDSAATTHLIESLREDRNVDVRVRAALH